MAGKKQFPNGKWQYVFKRKGVLEKPLYLTFDTEAEGDEYADRLETLLARGIVPMEHHAPHRILTVRALIQEYERDAHPSRKDRGTFGPILAQHGMIPLTDLNAAGRGRVRIFV